MINIKLVSFHYYKRARKDLKYVVHECEQGWPTWLSVRIIGYGYHLLEVKKVRYDGQNCIVWIYCKTVTWWFDIGNACICTLFDIAEVFVLLTFLWSFFQNDELPIKAAPRPKWPLSTHFKFSVSKYTHSFGSLQVIIDATQAQKGNCCMIFALFQYQWEIIISSLYWSERAMNWLNSLPKFTWYYFGSVCRRCLLTLPILFLFHFHFVHCFYSMARPSLHNPLSDIQDQVSDYIMNQRCWISANTLDLYSMVCK